MSATVLDSKEDLEKVIRRALIEVHVMQEGMPLDNAMTAYETGKEREHFVMKYPELLKRAYFVAGERGQHAKLVFAESPPEDVDMTEDRAITSLAEAEAISISEILEEILGMPAPTDAWRDVSISDLKVKFAVSLPSPIILAPPPPSLCLFLLRSPTLYRSPAQSLTTANL